MFSLPIVRQFVAASLLLVCAQSLTAATPRASWMASNIKGSPTAPLPYRVELAFPDLHFKSPKSVVEIPGTGRLLVAHDGSKLVSFPKDATVRETSVVADLEKVEGHYAGAYTVAFHPDFGSNRFMFVAMGHDDGGWHSRVMRYTLSNDPVPTVVPGSGKFVIRWPAGGHSGGCLGFGKDGFLYISTGDASGPTPPDRRTTGQDVSDLLGAVLRINVDVEAAYEVPGDNPFVDLENARPEIWSYGLRNPWKFGIDPKTGDVFVADNGWETWEMIHKLHRGSNCGWPIMEGRAKLRTEVALGPTPITPPVKDHPHTEANSVIGGPVYRGDAMEDLAGTFVYGDYITGTVWGLKSGDGDEFEHRTLADSDLHIVAFAEGSNGEVFLLDYDTTGQLYRLVPSSEPDTSAQFPRKLSETGIFKDVASLEVAEGVVPYHIKAEPWMDGASATRWAAVPGASPLDLDSNEFPEGTVLVKHLSIKDEHESIRPLETQVLQYEGGSWNPYSYLWQLDGKDATLVPPEGQNIEIELGAGAQSRRTWRAGSTNECRLCHNAGSGVVLGFNARQLDTLQQLDELTTAGLFAANPSYDGNTLVSPHDASASLNDRGRSYLHMNCGICHNKQGPATVSFFAHRDYDFKELRITKKPGVGNFGIADAQLVKPGAPYSSVILYRLAKLGYGRMPYVGSRVVDGRGIDLMEQWIASLSDTHPSTPDTSDPETALQTTEGALALVTKLHRGNPTAGDLATIHRAASKHHSDIRGLLEHFIPESERRSSLGQNPDPQDVLSLAGDEKRGELIFLSDNARCKSCHDSGDPTRSLGPTLSELQKKYPRRGEMLTHILKPSEKIEDRYAAWTFVTTDGKVHVGMIRQEVDGQITLETADRQRIVLAREDVEESKRVDRSLMPEGVLADLTAQEASDLLAFLTSGAKSD